MKIKASAPNPELKNSFTISISILALLVAAGSLIVSIRTCSLSERQLKLQLEPELVCVLDDHPDKDHFLLFTLKNEGAVKATIVSVDHVTLQYLKSEGRIYVGTSYQPSYEYNLFGKRWLFTDSLEPNQSIYKLIGEGAIRDSIMSVDVLVFDVSYYRESDGNKYQKRCLYYVEGKTINTAAQFRTNPAYEKVVAETSAFLRNVWIPTGNRE
jgi:hypothetical protein